MGKKFKDRAIALVFLSGTVCLVLAGVGFYQSPVTEDVRGDRLTGMIIGAGLGQNVMMGAMLLGWAIASRGQHDPD